MSDEGNFDLYAHIVNKTVDYHTAIFTTFNFDIEYFEKNVLNLLINADTRKIVVYVDYMQFQNSIQNYEPRHLGAKYILRLVDLSGASFHPKLVLLLSNQEIRLIAGSGNVTYTGHKINNEIFNFIDYKYGEKENAKAVKLALEFIKTIEEQFVIKDRFSVVKDMLKSIPTIDESDSKDDRMIIHNLNRSIFEQLKEIIDDNITAIKIAVPYYDNELLALSNVMNTFKIMPIIYLQNLKCLFPKEYNDTNQIIKSKNINVVSKINGTEKFYHGKVFLFKGMRKDYIVYGSSNCTSAALFKTKNNGGNVELDFFEIGNKGEFDSFFSTFELDKNSKLKCNQINVKQNEKNKYAYLSGYLVKNEFTCSIRTNSRTIRSITVNGIKAEFVYDQHNIIKVKAKLDDYFEDTCLLTIEIIDDSGNEKITGWFNHQDRLMAFIRSNDQNGIFEIEELNSGAESLEKYRKLLEKMKLNVEEQKEYKRKEQNQMNDKDQKDEFEDDYIVEFVPTSSFEYERHEQKHIMKVIRKSLIRNTNHIHSIIRKCPEQKEIDEVTHQHLPEDIRFVRYFKSRIKYLVKREYYQIVDTEQYLSNISLIFEIINELSKNRILLFGRNLLISNDELLPFLTEMVYIILSKNLAELNDVEREYIFKASIRIALLNIELDTEKATKLNDKIMNELDYDFELFNALNTKVLPVLIEYYQDESKAIPIIEKFEFIIKRKSWKYISKKISGQYGGVALEIVDNTLIFKQVDKNHFPTTSLDKLIKETINKFKSCSERNIVEPIKYFRFEKVEDENDKNNFIVATIVNIKNIKPQKKYFRKNGKCDSEWIALER